MKSNCLIEALKAKSKNHNVKIHALWHLQPDSIFPHFWWELDGSAYSFVSYKPRRLQVFWFKGFIQKTSLYDYEKFVEICRYSYQKFKDDGKQKVH